MNMARSCGTCRDRRIACDKALPACSQCRQSSRKCKGYGIRLSWPRANDPKRAVVCRAPVRLSKPNAVRGFQFQVNASSWDIEVHHNVLGSLSTFPAKPSTITPLPFDAFEYNDSEGQLFEYFKTTASKSLPILGHNPTDLGSLLLRISFTTTSPATLAVRTAILAYASIHLHGVQGQAFDLKIAALNSLRTASNKCIKGFEHLHLAAGMLLCSFDIHRAACTSGQWRFYIKGVKSVIGHYYLLEYMQGHRRGVSSDIAMLLDWVKYHDALARFSSLHWYRERANVCFPTQICLEVHARYQGFTAESLRNPGSRAELAVTLMQVLEYGCEALTGRLKAAGAKIDYSIQNLYQLLQPVPFSPTDDITFELFYHAILVYLNRASRHTLEPASTTQKRIERAFSLFGTIDVLPRQFPLFILGAEARTDEERCLVLKLFDRTEKDDSSRSLFLVREFVNMVWVQKDLTLDEGGGSGSDSEKGPEIGLRYKETFNAALGVTMILPPFV
ncbi:Zn(II)2Cys6 transcription factor [Aspergillus stella-maris]|uniref:Zn(II)2Cys6 transcription factor n=1 Tax=Aspergillus stella-maris TaxID=1810926 RepID=UPI003CCD28BD